MWIIKACHRWNNYTQPLKDEGKGRGATRGEDQEVGDGAWSCCKLIFGTAVALSWVVSFESRYPTSCGEPGAADEWSDLERFILTQHMQNKKKKALQQPEGQASFWILAVQDWKGKADLSRVSIQLLEQLLSKCALEQDVNPRLVQGGCFNGQQIRTRVCVISPV